jgi:small subunit ribosomal protein S29
MAYPMDGRDAIELFGLPKNLLLEVRVSNPRRIEGSDMAQFRLLPKPCSVIRDVTVQALDLLDAASEKRSLDTRVIFS